MIIDEESAFCSKPIYCNHTDVESDINEICTFRLEQSAYPYISTEDIILKV